MSILKNKLQIDDSRSRHVVSIKDPASVIRCALHTPTRMGAGASASALPEVIDRKLAKDLAGVQFNEDQYDRAADDEGKLTKEQLLELAAERLMNPCKYNAGSKQKQPQPGGVAKEAASSQKQNEVVAGLAVVPANKNAFYNPLPNSYAEPTTPVKNADDNWMERAETLSTSELVAVIQDAAEEMSEEDSHDSDSDSTNEHSAASNPVAITDVTVAVD
jgi:hypothetical protein